jgi:hypothetical protein
MSRDPALARKIWQRLEIIHAVTYFSPEPVGALRDAGYKGYWMGYFAGRSAPLGAVGPEVVTALFYNFAPARVARALPDAWGFAPPEAALSARREGSVVALRRALGDVDVVDVASLARRAAETAPPEGRTLFAANTALPWPDDPLAILWHAATLLREHRGDGHVAVLTAAGIAGREANVLHSSWGGAPPEFMSIGRDYDEAEWATNIAALAARGLLTTDGVLSDEGSAFKAELEERTDRIALSAYDSLDDGEVERMIAALTPLAQAVIATGDVPPMTPIGPIAAVLAEPAPPAQ